MQVSPPLSAASGHSFLGKAQLYVTVNRAPQDVACQVQPHRGLEADTIFSVFCTSGRPVSTQTPSVLKDEVASSLMKRWGCKHPPGAGDQAVSVDSPPTPAPCCVGLPPCASLGGPDPGAHCSSALRLRVFPTNALSHRPCVVPPRGKQRCSLIPPRTLCVCDCPRSRQEGPRPRVTDSRLYLPQPIGT